MVHSGRREVWQTGWGWKGRQRPDLEGLVGSAKEFGFYAMTSHGSCLQEILGIHD